MEASGDRKRVHRVSEDRELAVELRVSLVVVFAMAALAVGVHVSLVLAGLVSRLAVAAVGEPRRVARQLFAVTGGFFGPLFFVWLGAVVAHPAPVAPHQPAPYALIAAAQLGVTVAAVTIGGQLGLLRPGEGAALILGALLTVAVTVAGGAMAAHRAAPPHEAAGDLPDVGSSG